MDGNQVSVYQYLWVDDSGISKGESETVLTIEEQKVIDELLIEFNDIFEEKPVEAVEVEPMEIEMKADW